MLLLLDQNGITSKWMETKATNLVVTFWVVHFKSEVADGNSTGVLYNLQHLGPKPRQVECKLGKTDQRKLGCELGRGKGLDSF